MLLTRLSSVRRPLPGAACACYAIKRRAATNGASSHRINEVRQGGTLVIRLCKPVATNVRVTSAWIDHVEVVQPASPSPALRIEVDESKQTVAILEPPAQPAVGAVPMTVSVVVPEKFGLDVAVGMGHVHVKGKVEGDVRLATADGDIRVGKLRGSTLSLEAKRGKIEVQRYMEGNTHLAAAALHARMLKGHEIRVDVRGEGSGAAGGPPVDIEALYGQQASIACFTYPPPEADKVAVRVARSHGALAVVVQGGGVSLGGVNGSAHVLGGAGPVDVQVEALEKRQGSLVSTSTGAVTLHVAPDVRARVEAETLGAPPSSFPGPEGSRIDPSSLMNLVTHKATHSSFAGVLRGVLPEASRATLKGPGRQVGQASGKIDLQGAQDQALQMYFEGGGVPGPGEGGEEELPLLRVQSQQGHMTLRTLSWMDAIKRQFGLEHIEYHVPPHGPKHKHRKK